MQSLTQPNSSWIQILATLLGLVLLMQHDAGAEATEIVLLQQSASRPTDTQSHLGRKETQEVRYGYDFVVTSETQTCSHTPLTIRVYIRWQ
jgi:hypothetical protein